MKQLSLFRYRRAAQRRSRRPLTRREVRALLSAADREPQVLDLKSITALIEEQE